LGFALHCQLNELVFQISPFGFIRRLRQLAPGILVVYVRNMLQQVLSLLLHRRDSLMRSAAQSA
jgi:hypothetical protein